MSIVSQLQQAVSEALETLYQQAFTPASFQISQTKPEFDGDYTVVLFSLVKQLRQSPDAIGQSLGETLRAQHPWIEDFNLIKGFLNLSISNTWWKEHLNNTYANANYGQQPSSGKKVMVEYASPNTNKPLHLGHLRNIFLGWSVAEILKANGHEVIKTCIVNDRGIHICKSMLAWQRFGQGATPASTGIKGDHLVGDYYVQFSNALKAEVEALVAAGKTKEQAEKEAPIMQAAQQMLVDWEAGKPEVIELWKTMNQWVYQGFDVTYQRIGADFHKTYYESNTYLLGKDIVQEGLDKGVFFRKDDGSIWIDLTADGLDEKIVQRKDGTSVYITQDIGLAKQKYDEFGIDQSIYVIGNEQNYHMKVLQLICQKLAMPNANNIHHLSYGMVELTTGKMKSREGTVVDADDIIQDMADTAARHTKELGKVDGFTETELAELYDTIALGATKFYLLRVDPKKTMVFNPEESIDFHGFTGAFVQYTYARIQSILRKAGGQVALTSELGSAPLEKLEKELILAHEQYPGIIQQSGQELDPSVLAVFLFNLAKTFNSFYSAHSVAQAESNEKKELRLKLAQATAQVIRHGMSLLGIRVPERM